MKIYTVMITCNYDGENLELFTSLSKAVKFAQQRFVEAIDFEFDPNGEGIMDDDDRKYMSDLYATNCPLYLEVKNAIIQSCDEYNSYSTQICREYHWACVISMYDTDNKDSNGALKLW